MTHRVLTKPSVLAVQRAENQWKKGLARIFSPLLSSWNTGATLHHCLNKTRQLNCQGVKTVIQFAGKSFTDTAQVFHSLDQHEALIRALATEQKNNFARNNTVSLRASQFGTALSLSPNARYPLAMQHLHHLVEKAHFYHIPLQLEWEPQSKPQWITDFYQSQLPAFVRQPQYWRFAFPAASSEALPTLHRLAKFGSLTGTRPVVLIQDRVPISSSRISHRRLNQLFEQCVQKALELESLQLGISTHQPQLVEKTFLLGKEYGKKVDLVLPVGSGFVLKKSWRQQHPFWAETLSYGPYAITEALDDSTNTLRRLLNDATQWVGLSEESI